MTAKSGCVPALHDQDGEAAAAPAAKQALIVEDNVANRTILKLMLDHLGVTTRVAEDGAIGVAAAREVPFDIVFMDLHMPNVDGYAAARTIRAEEGPNKATPIIAVTADGSPGVVERVQEAGMDLYIQKPVELRSIFDAMNAFVYGRGEASPGSDTQSN